MDKEKKNVALILLVLALFIGMTIEISEGSTAVGTLLFTLAAILMTKIEFKQLSNSKTLKGPKTYLIIGLLIVSCDLFYNLRFGGDFGTLDIMILVFGLSLMGSHSQNSQINRISRFGTYISATFVFLFLIFYSMFAALKIDIMHKFDHYFILLPTVWLLGLVGIPLEIISTETVRLSGIEEMIVIIGGPCSGLYSMFLLIGIVFGYSRIENMDKYRTLKMLGISIAIAYVSNLFRIIILYLTAYLYGQEAMMTVHTHIGWIIFAGIAALIIYFIDSQK